MPLIVNEFWEIRISDLPGEGRHSATNQILTPNEGYNRATLYHEIPEINLEECNP